MKPLEEFSPEKRRTTGRQAQCKICIQRLRLETRTPEITRRNNLKWNYNISPEDYQKMYKSQEGKCAICKKPFELLHIDHCHNSNRIRGLLCTNCNLGIGNMQDDIQILQNAIDYLKR